MTASVRTRIKRMDHVGIVVDDVPAAIAFFTELGLELEGQATLEKSSTVDRINGLEGVRADVAMLLTPDGNHRIELCEYHAPATHASDQKAPPNTMGLRHVAFVVEGIDDILERLRARGYELVGEVVQFEGSYRLCYVRGPAGVIVELAEAVA